MFGFGTMEIAIIALVAVLLFGSRLPKLARSLGSSIVEFKKGVADIEKDKKILETELKDIEETITKKETKNA